MCSSQLPAGGFQVTAFALCGGSESPELSPFLRDRFPLACGVDEDGRPLFLLLIAAAVSSKSLSRPPILA